MDRHAFYTEEGAVNTVTEATAADVEAEVVAEVTVKEVEEEALTEVFMRKASPTVSVQSGRWNIFGSNYPRSEIVFFSQLLIILVVICASVYNLSTGVQDSTLWTALLSSSLSYVLPSPSIRPRNIPE